MNFEQMQTRLKNGLTIIENTSGDVSVIAHSYMIAVPDVNRTAYSEADAEALFDDGWTWSDNFGFVFPCLA